MKVELTSHIFHPWTRIHAFEEDELRALKGKYGAVSTFVGTMRNEGDTVDTLFLEHYPGMTEKTLYSFSETAAQRWNILDTLIIHRVGEIQAGETIVLVAAWAAHRAPAFEACRFLIETLKSQAPFWKRETLKDGVRWVGK